MAQQMNSILLLLVLIGLVGVLLVVFFTLEKVNDIATGKSPSKPRFNATDSFGGLFGKDLWDAMIGVPIRGITPKEILGLKPRYEVVLQKHLEILFEEGQRDGREGFPMPVRCERVVPTLRGEIESWIPHAYASGIYKIGYSLITESEEDLDKLREQLDEIGDELFYAAGLPPIPLSKLLLPFKEEQELPPEMPEEFPPEPELAADMADVSEDAADQAQTRLEAPVAIAEAENTASETTDATATPTSATDARNADAAASAEAPVARAGDSLPVIQKEKEAESLPAG